MVSTYAQFGRQVGGMAVFRVRGGASGITYRTPHLAIVVATSVENDKILFDTLK
jgi:hypothetical protein